MSQIESQERILQKLGYTEEQRMDILTDPFPLAFGKAVYEAGQRRQAFLDSLRDPVARVQTIPSAKPESESKRRARMMRLELNAERRANM